jgi:hypothetical protein
MQDLRRGIHARTKTLNISVLLEICAANPRPTCMWKGKGGTHVPGIYVPEDCRFITASFLHEQTLEARRAHGSVLIKYRSL